MNCFYTYYINLYGKVFYVKEEEIGLMIWFRKISGPNYTLLFIDLLTYVTLQLISKINENLTCNI